ncbi:hypothetical protein AZI87_00980 [Bdellovibrio bacteriovorus]|uniref:Uncharacterized protein n=1 Tax=Bdellovibrio bacteriovorus TaxID=959 RepID=A0A162GDG8_BDEBC|nr:hypothetical protein AZI87_00980 [Bdellovibrio bacteriovorus]
MPAQDARTAGTAAATEPGRRADRSDGKPKGLSPKQIPRKKPKLKPQKRKKAPVREPFETAKITVGRMVDLVAVGR